MNAILKNQRLTLLWALFILIICNINLGSVGESHLFFPGFDKLVHCGLFFVFVIFCTNGVIRQQENRRLSYAAAFFILILALAFGGLIEILQLTVFTWRDGNWPDMFADTIGACMAIFSVLIINDATAHVKK